AATDAILSRDIEYEARFPPAVKAIGAAVAGGVASGAATAATDAILNRRQVSVADLTVRDLIHVMNSLRMNDLE
ncbi:hypothetical protein OF83DRAFT_1169565, partial [Amylostereum chailletii]